ncbi:MAG: glycosyltransferase family 2 protein [Thermomicrobiales bacterium]|nr:glycosyltransferase family 2 protein [Thermomicrobiales bacterium]
MGSATVTDTDAKTDRDFVLSVIVPVYNEVRTITEILQSVRAVDIPKQIIVVDDMSTDGTREKLEDERQHPDTIVVLHDVNRGKGGAVRTGLEHATGDIVLIQDADLEYDPRDYRVLLRPILEGRAEAVYGSRFLGEHKAMYFWHALGNKFLTLVTNVLFDTTLTDMETCYKVFTIDIAKSLNIQQMRWGIDPEITAKILRDGHRIYEVPISYNGREFWEGKKISWKDAFVVLRTLIRYRFFR